MVQHLFQTHNLLNSCLWKSQFFLKSYSTLSEFSETALYVEMINVTWYEWSPMSCSFSNFRESQGKLPVFLHAMKQTLPTMESCIFTHTQAHIHTLLFLKKKHLFLCHTQQPQPPIPGIHAAGERLPLSAVHHGHWHEALSASDPLSLITDKHAVQKAQKSCVMSAVTYIT